METMAIRNNKQVKLQPKNRKASNGHKIVPCLSLSGLWLEELGFKVGDTVRILSREKLLIIEIIPLEEQDQSKKNLEVLKKQLKSLIK
jgi:hypothetical protein